MISEQIAKGLVSSLSPKFPVRVPAVVAPPEVPLVPWPKEINVAGGMMELKSKNNIVAGENLEAQALVLQREIFLMTGLKLSISKSKRRAGDIALVESGDKNSSAYEVLVSDHAEVRAGNGIATGFGTATLLQSIRQKDGKAYLPRMTIKDSPDYPYRALMLDLGRKWHSIDGVKQVVELCRLYKLRYLHLHLSDDQLFMFPSTAFPTLGKGNREFFAL